MNTLYRNTERKGSAKILVIIAIVVIACAAFFVGSKSSMPGGVLGITTEDGGLDAGNTEENEGIAREIVKSVRKLIVIEDDIDPTVATIIDIDTLKARNPFYAKAENGDYLIVTTDRAILYSKKLNVILDVVPVQLQQADDAQ